MEYVQLLNTAKLSLSEYTSDLCTYCTVAEVVEVHQQVDLSSVRHTMINYYRYIGYVTTHERDELVHTFGYLFKESRIK